MLLIHPPRPILVVKVGTSTLTDSDGRIDRSFLIDLATQLSTQQSGGWHVILVTSGAIRAGHEALKTRRAEPMNLRQQQSATDKPQPSDEPAASLPYKQAVAAIGQGRLMHTYTEAFAWRNVDCAQVLLTRDDIGDSRRFDNARNTLGTLLTLGVIPIINENDTVAVDEIKFGDNDNLAALVAILIQADLLLILSDVDGLYIGPAAEPGKPRPPVSIVTRIDDSILAHAGEPGEFGTGGMRTKIEAARMATERGITTIIACGRRPDVVADAVSGRPIGTTFLAGKSSEQNAAESVNGVVQIPHAGGKGTHCPDGQTL